MVFVYTTRPTTGENLIARIQNAINDFPEGEEEAAVFSCHNNLHQCIGNDRKHFEQLTIP